MLFRFRICQISDAADTAQGWVVASSELHARSLLGDYAYLQRVTCKDEIDAPVGTIFVTEGKLDG